MTRPIITHSFIAGELDRPFYSRTDLQKYPLGVARAFNFYIDFRGGLKSRPGFEFASLFPSYARMFIFPRGEGLSPFLCFFVEGALYLWQEDEFLADSAVSVVAQAGAELTLTSASTFAEDDLVYLGEHIFRVSNVTGDVITVASVSSAISPPTVSEVFRVFSLETPYGPVCLPTLKTHFWLNSLVVTCNTRRPYELVFEENEFEFRPATFTAEVPAPTGISVTSYRVSGTGTTRSSAVATGNAMAVFAVIAIDEEGKESLLSRPFLKTGLYNYAAEAGSATITWSAVPGAVKYRIYRSIITESILDISTRLGYIGESSTTTFVDDNYIPDYIMSPAQEFDPFANGALLFVKVTNGGSGYDANTTTITSTGGTGFVGYPIIREGVVEGVMVVASGTGYQTTDTLTVVGGGGSGATLEITATSPLTGNYPAVSVVAQQRRYFAGTPNLPITFYGSRIGNYYNFSSIAPPSADDGFSFSLDAQEISPIKHLVRARNGMLIMHGRGVDRLLGSEGKAISAISREIENQSDIGVGQPVPAFINDDIIFSTPRGAAVISMGYTFYTNSYNSQEVSVLAPHLIGKGKAPVRFEWIAEPDKMLWAQREDGALLSLTYMKEQEIFAWAQHKTEGKILDICAVAEADRDILYALVERDTGVQLEKLAIREIDDLATYVGSDSAITITNAEPVSEITGLELFEGKEVSVLADGDALRDVLVEDGKITLSNPAKTVVVGLPFLCEGVSLPLSDPEALVDSHRRRLVGLAARLFETRGLEIGADPRAIYEMKDRGFEDWDEKTSLRSDVSYVPLADNWKRDAQVIFRQRYPLPAHILGYVTEVEAGK